MVADWDGDSKCCRHMATDWDAAPGLLPWQLIEACIIFPILFVGVRFGYLMFIFSFDLFDANVSNRAAVRTAPWWQFCTLRCFGLELSGCVRHGGGSDILHSGRFELNVYARCGGGGPSGGH